MTFLYKPKHGGTPDVNRCRAQVSAGHWHWSQCSRPVKVMRAGIGYCGQHDPVARQEKNEARNRAGLERFERESAQRKYSKALEAFRCDAVEALRLIADGHNDARGVALEALAKEPKPVF